MDERRFHDRRRPSHAAIQAEHDRLVRAQQLADLGDHVHETPPEPAEGDAGPMLPDPTAAHVGEAMPGRSPERERVRQALQRLARGRRTAGRQFSDVGQADEHERIRRVVGPLSPHVEPEPLPEGIDHRAALAERREFLKSRGVDLDGVVIMHPPAKVGQGDQRTTLGANEIEYDHPPQIHTRRRR